jgi:hypothetical protein
MSSVYDNQLEAYIQSKKACTVEFHNGCVIHLISDDGLYWGNSPYGVEWACNADSQHVSTIATWVRYWDIARDETGRKLLPNPTTTKHKSAYDYEALITVKY